MEILCFNLILALLVLSSIYKATAVLIRKRLRATLTAVDDIPLLGQPRKSNERLRGTAVICGGSIAGLLTARVCSDHFNDVIIVEPEEWVTTTEGFVDRHRQGPSITPPFRNRSRVPQYTCLHGYQCFMLMALRKWFPNIDIELRKVGARIGYTDQPSVHWSGIPGVPPFPLGPNTRTPKLFTLTRPALETLLRRLVIKACPNIKYVCGTATGLLLRENRDNTIASVRVRSQNGEDNIISTTFVVDCTGPALGGLRWLKELPLNSDVSTKREKALLPFNSLKTSYNPKVAYSTCEFDISPRLYAAITEIGLPIDDENIFFFVFGSDYKVDNKHFAITRRERSYVQVVCGGLDVRDRMTNVGDIKSFLSTIISARPLPEWIHRFLDILEKECVPAVYHFHRCPPPLYVQYSRAQRLPKNFVAVGDSVLQLSPVNGCGDNIFLIQGCTKACVEAVTLNGLLARIPSGPDRSIIPNGFARTFFALQAKRTSGSWAQHKYADYERKSTIPADGEDLQTTGARQRAFGAALLRLMLKDQKVAKVRFFVGHYLAPPTDLLSPAILLKLAWMLLKDHIGL
ncbi:hypothetical protein K439DRAFT_1624087 [Ramaria rubella]|nr:hypothetical protein K439DRAFT_1624087 [Ramaria rubella]